jgi:hypothetical protein
MPEKHIAVAEFFSLVKSKPAKICKVAYCPNKLRAGYATLCQRHKMQLWRARNPMRSAFANLRASAHKRKLEFGLSFEEFNNLVNGTRYIEDRGNNAGCYHIDRINPCAGYVAGNIQILTIEENTAKGNVERRNAEYIQQLLIRKGYTVDEPEEEEEQWDTYGGNYRYTPIEEMADTLDTNCPF